MGKRIIQQARGKGGPAYRAPKRTFRYKLNYPSCTGKGVVLKLLNSPGHSAPLAKIAINKKIFFNVAVDGLKERQTIEVGGNVVSPGNILQLRDIPVGTSVCNIETVPFAGPKLVRAGGTEAKVVKNLPQGVVLLLPSKKEMLFDGKARATVGKVAAGGRLEKPIVKAGKAFYMKKAKGKLWPRTSAVKMNVIDHPFGSGRGKRIKSKIAKRNVPPGAKVGLIRPRRTGRLKK